MLGVSIDVGLPLSKMLSYLAREPERLYHRLLSFNLSGWISSRVDGEAKKRISHYVVNGPLRSGPTASRPST